MKMTYLIIIALTLGLSYVLFSCSTTKPASTPVATKDTIDQALIRLKAGSCRGKCKSYEMALFESGRATLVPKRNMEQTSPREIEISKEELASLTQIFESNDFLDLATSYLSPAKDIQQFEMTYHEKTVKFHKRKAPENLLVIWEALHQWVEDTPW